MHKSCMQRSFVCMSNTCKNCVHRSCMQISCMCRDSACRDSACMHPACSNYPCTPYWSKLPKGASPNHPGNCSCPSPALWLYRGNNFSLPALTQLETQQHWEKAASGRMRQQEREKRTKLTGSGVLCLSGRWVVLLHYAHPAVPHSLHFLFGTSLKTFCCLPAAVFSGAFLHLSPAPEHPITPPTTRHIRHLQCSFFLFLSCGGSNSCIPKAMSTTLLDVKPLHRLTARDLPFPSSEHGKGPWQAIGMPQPHTLSILEPLAFLGWS